MPCIMAIFALATPRVVIVLLWFFTHWFDRFSRAPLWPILGFIFLPTSFLWYTAVLHWYHGEWSLVPIVGMLIALTIDVSPHSSRRRW